MTLKNSLNTQFSASDSLYERALRTIPLASQTFSKSAMQHVRGASPLFLSHAQGAYCWDVDDNRYIDYILGLMPVILGHGDPDVNAAIRKQLERGISFSMPTALETELAERLVKHIPCAEMVRFAKNGSDATSAAMRLARAYTGRDKVLACGYHGWHDWYIGSTTRDLGVPSAVKALTQSVPYNDADAVEKIFSAAPNDFAALILEPTAVYEPAPGYLERLRTITEKYGVVLVFDEIVTGFRISLGGAQKYYGVTPDLACFGKAMGNGMPISAILGKREIMSLMTEIFFSGTFGGEALSLAAAISTIDKLEATDGPAKITAQGRNLKQGLSQLFTKHGLDEQLSIIGGDWWPVLKTIEPVSLKPNLFTSLLRQELAAQGILMMASFNLSLAHCDPLVESETLSAWDQALAAVAMAIRSPNPDSHLRGDPISPVFKVRG